MRIVEITVFIALSSALHAATLALAPQRFGSDAGGGDRGAAEVTLHAATPTLAAMVQDWERPPEVSAAPSWAPPEVTSPPDQPIVKAPSDRPPSRVRDQAGLPAPEPAPDLPQAETRLPAPPVPLAQTTAEAPQLPAPDGTDAPDRPVAQSPARPRAPEPSQLPALDTETARLVPDVDTTPAATQAAPQASLRPALRPDRPVRRATPTPPQPPSAAQPQRSAQGSGPGQTARPARNAPAASGPSQAQLARLEQQWGASITAALRRAHRPPRGARGTVQLVISVTPAGQVAGVSLAASSGDARLDQAALAAVNRARFPRAPDGLSKSAYRFSQRLTVAR